MLYLRAAFGFAVFVLWVFCLFDVITTDESRCRHLRKLWWILVVLFLSGVGAVLWLVVGRPRGPARSLPYKGNRGFPEYERPGRFVATSDSDDEEFPRRCRERAEEQRRRYREQHEPEADQD